MKTRKLSLAMQIFLALVLAIIVGLLLEQHPQPAASYLRSVGTIFLNLLKFIIGPVVLFSILCGMLSMKDIKKVGAIGLKTVLYYLITTAFAITIGLAVASGMKSTFPTLSTTGLSYQGGEPFSFLDTLIHLFPANFLAPLVEGNMLQIIFIATFLGVGMILLGDKVFSLRNAILQGNVLFVKLMELILKLSPVGVFCLLSPVVAENGAAVIGSLAMVLLAAYLCYAIHALLVYSLAVRTLGGLGPGAFFRGMLPAMLFAFSSASSVGTLPLNLECCEKLGADKEVSAFVLPLGATINMDGTAIYQGVCAVFIASCFGIELTLSQMATIVITATLTSIGTAGVPGAGMLMLAMVLTSVGLPVEGIGLVAGIDRLFDMGRTVLNITGDASCAIIISHLARKRGGKRSSSDI